MKKLITAALAVAIITAGCGDDPSPSDIVRQSPAAPAGDDFDELARQTFYAVGADAVCLDILLLDRDAAITLIHSGAAGSLTWDEASRAYGIWQGMC